jgi:peptide/nickel transport system substrate-binding protein
MVRHAMRAMRGVATLGVLVLCACSGGGGPVGESGPPFNPDVAVNHRDAHARGPVTLPGAQRGGIVTVLTQGGLTTTLDPSEIYYVDTSSVFSGLIGRSLTQYRYDPSTHGMTLVPDLATDLGQHNDDFTKWTFTIRSGVKWGENGQLVTARDVAWGMTRCMDAKTFPTGACQFYSNVYYRGGSAYRGPYTSGQRALPAITVKGSTITIRMNEPFPDMPYWGTFPANGPVPQDPQISNPTAYKLHPWSTGPYMIETYHPARELVLKRNPYWVPSTDPGRTQYPDGYDFRLQVATARIDQILLADSGQGQTSLTFDDLLAPDYQQLRQKDPSRLTLGGAPCTYYWAPDNRKVTDKRVREALSWAFPYKDVIIASGRIPGVNAIPATNLMAPGVPGRTPYNVTGRAGFESDPVKARTLLEQAGAVGFEIRFLYQSDDPVSVRIKDEIVKGLTAAGFTVSPVPVSTGAYSKAMDNTSEDVNLRAAGWCSDWPSGLTWVPTLLGSTDPDRTKRFGANYAAFSKQGVDARIAAILRLPLEAQPGAWNDLDRRVAAKYFPVFPTFYAGVAQAHGSKVHGDYDDDILGMPTWKDIWISG